MIKPSFIKTDNDGSDMRKVLALIYFTSIAAAAYSQALTCESILNAISLPERKQEVFFIKKGYFPKASDKINDTSVKVYDLNAKALNKKSTDSIRRKITKKSFGGDDILTYQTASFEESIAFKDQLLKNGFYFLNDIESVSDTTPLLYQHQNLTVHFNLGKIDSTKMYTFRFFKKSFPHPADMYYADDLLNFTSHEYLVYFFGDENVKKDVCFFSDDQIAKCSVLFLNTNRQVVFIWEDEVNRSSISSLLIGGQQKLKSQQDYDRYVAENNWLLKSGIHAGMSLYELRLLHGADIHFYGGNAINTGEVLANNDGKLNFKKESVILGCMNCRDNKFAGASVINADDALKDGRILFVLSIIVRPGAH